MILVVGFPVSPCGSGLHHFVLILQFTSCIALYQASVCVIFAFFLLALPWGFVIGFLQFIGYYFTFAQKFKFQCDWCMGSLGACGRVAGSACHVGGLTLMYIMGFRLQGECWACFSWVPNLHL